MKMPALSLRADWYQGQQKEAVTQRGSERPARLFAQVRSTAWLGGKQVQPQILNFFDFDNINIFVFVRGIAVLELVNSQLHCG